MSFTVSTELSLSRHYSKTSLAKIHLNYLSLKFSGWPRMVAACIEHGVLRSITFQLRKLITIIVILQKFNSIQMKINNVNKTISMHLLM